MKLWEYAPNKNGTFKFKEINKRAPRCDVLWRKFQSGKSINELASEYGLHHLHIEDAIRRYLKKLKRHRFA